EQDLRNLNINENDTVIGIAASGRTPYVIGGLKYAQSIGVPTGCVTCNQQSEVGNYADFPVQVDVGPEVLKGSTRLKAGTDKKLLITMILNDDKFGNGICYDSYLIIYK